MWLSDAKRLELRWGANSSAIRVVALLAARRVDRLTGTEGLLMGAHGAFVCRPQIQRWLFALSNIKKSETQAPAATTRQVSRQPKRRVKIRTVFIFREDDDVVGQNKK